MKVSKRTNFSLKIKDNYFVESLKPLISRVQSQYRISFIFLSFCLELDFYTDNLKLVKLL